MSRQTERPYGSDHAVQLYRAEHQFMYQVPDFAAVFGDLATPLFSHDERFPFPEARGLVVQTGIRPVLHQEITISMLTIFQSEKPIYVRLTNRGNGRVDQVDARGRYLEPRTTSALDKCLTIDGLTTAAKVMRWMTDQGRTWLGNPANYYNPVRARRRAKRLSR